MDLNLVTGQPGASKTLNTIKAVEKRRLEEGRPVFYANIDGLVFDWQKMDDVESLLDNPDAITPHTWFKAPEGAIIVIDECQDFFPAVSSTIKQPDYIMKMAKFRHLGYSMYLITQGPNLINRNIREWVQPHIHYRRLFGGKSAMEYTNEQCIDNPRNLTGLAKNAILRRVRIDKKMYGTYKSAAQHNTNTRLNKKLLAFFLIPLFIIPLSIYYLYSFYQSEKSGFEEKPETLALTDGGTENKQNSVSSSPNLDIFRRDENERRFNPMVEYQPRIPTMPETAPAYDNLRRAVSFPRPQCMDGEHGCKCYTQQATFIADYPEELCKAFVKYGRFDPTMVDIRRGSGSRRESKD